MLPGTLRFRSPNVFEITGLVFRVFIGFWGCRHTLTPRDPRGSSSAFAVSLQHSFVQCLCLRTCWAASLCFDRYRLLWAGSDKTWPVLNVTVSLFSSSLLLVTKLILYSFFFFSAPGIWSRLPHRPLKMFRSLCLITFCRLWQNLTYLFILFKNETNKRQSHRDFYYINAKPLISRPALVMCWYSAEILIFVTVFVSSSKNETKKRLTET